MNGLELYRLGRRLMKMGEAATAGTGLPTSARLMLEDIVLHEGSSITEITSRTGFPQSQVSAFVSRLRDRGVVLTESDPSDRRRTLVRVSPGFTRTVAERGAMPVEGVIAEALGSDDPKTIGAVVATLDWLANRLLAGEEGTDGGASDQGAGAARGSAT